jgi:hypothetical protein
MKTIFVALACVLSPVALAAPPPAPVVTVGASDIKQLQFDWPSVPGVATYELWFRAAPGAAWVKYAETPAQRRIIRINVSVHLLDWRVARYRVAACNPSGCTNSDEVGVADLADDVTGYLKPNYPGEAYAFGQAVALSADGMTAAVSLRKSTGNDEGNGVFYVYRKASSTAGWRFEARVVPSLIRSSGGSSLAVNRDGTLIAFGRGGEGVGGDPGNGAVYLFRRTGTTWKQEKRLQSSVAYDNFGLTVKLDDAGNTLAVWHRDAPSRFSYIEGVTEIYSHSSGSWQHAATIPLPPSSQYEPSCQPDFALSGDGQRLFRTCFADAHRVVLVHDAPGWSESARIVGYDETKELDTNYDGTLFVARRGYAFADVYRLEQNVWSPDRGSPLNFNIVTDSLDPRSTSIAMSRDGKIIAAGDGEDVRGVPGVNYPPVPPEGSAAPGTVYVWERKPSGWKLRRYLKPTGDSHYSYGTAVAVGNNGKNLIVGAFSDESGATGINGDPSEAPPSINGAAWLY